MTTPNNQNHRDGDDFEEERTESPTRFCLDCGYPLDQLKSHLCPECGREFSPDDPATYRRPLVHPERVHTTSNQAEAYLLTHELICEGIPAVMFDAFPGMTGLGAVSIWVETPDVDGARSIIADFLERDSVDAGRSSSPPWTCARCGEEVEANFDICWNCQANRPSSDSSG